MSNVCQEALKLWINSGLPDDPVKIIGVRRSGTTSLEDLMDDSYIVQIGMEWFSGIVGTTDPGRRVTLDPSIVGRIGAGHVKPGPHYEIWQRGIHLKSHPDFAHQALVQTGAPITVIRDVNKDGIISKGDVEETGWFGVDFHRAHKLMDVKKVGDYSWLCQVVQHAETHEMLMIKMDQILKKDAKISYYLALEEQLKDAFAA